MLVSPAAAAAAAAVVVKKRAYNRLTYSQRLYIKTIFFAISRNIF